MPTYCVTLIQQGRSESNKVHEIVAPNPRMAAEAIAGERLSSSVINERIPRARVWEANLLPISVIEFYSVK